MSRSLVVGDIHGRAAALEEVLEKCNFDRVRDTLISLGDIVDGGRETKRCFEILETIPNKIICLGNHEEWCLNWFLMGIEYPLWVHQGGYATMESYGFDRTNVPDSHKCYSDYNQEAYKYPPKTKLFPCRIERNNICFAGGDKFLY